MSNSSPREAAVRAYLTALAEFGSALQVLDQGERCLRDGLAPFADVAEHLATEAPAAPSTPALDGLWRPRDPDALLGLTDVYEVPGRFAFQGDDDANLRALAERVTAARAELARQLTRLEQLAAAPARISAAAESMERTELENSRAQEAELLRQFEPEAAQLRDLCKRLLEAVRATRRPDLSRLDAADALYLEYVARVGGLYGKALPVLREAIAALSKVARCEVPPSWPDALPFAPHLPDDLITSPVPESPAAQQLRQALESEAQQEAALLRAQDELGVQLRRVDGEVTAMVQRETELLREVEVAKLVLRWCTRHDTVDVARGALAAIQSEGQARTQALAAVQSEGQRLAAQIAAVQTDATEWAQAVQAKEAAAAKHRGDEPALFGKDDWRKKLLELEDETNDLRGELQQRQARIVEGNAELARIRGRESAEQAAIVTLTQQLDEGRRREAQSLKELLEVEKELGPAVPPRRLPSAQAEEMLAAAVAARNELRARVERLTTESRRVKEDADRAAVQLKQLAAERARTESGLAVALRQSGSAHEEALRSLAVRRQAAFESHAGQVLAGLEESLAQVDRNFIEPARRAMLVRAGVMTDAPVTLRARGGALEAALPELRARWAAVVDPAVETLAAVAGGFLATIGARARSAWRGASA
ncbi:MAG: uncharacterized protein JWM10_2704 [Myxococcaceae bacterium]|nr:uncharacterized protein [Myxococcaceae bacterium]